MRVSSNTQYIAGTYSLGSQQGLLTRLQEQLSTLKRVNRPSDDPVASSQIINLMQSQSRNAQMIENAQTVVSKLSMSESLLHQGSEVIQAMKTLAVNAGNGSLKDTDKKALQNEFRERVRELVGIANSTDANGDYLFGGTQTQSLPFELKIGSTISIEYKGNYGQQDIQVSVSREMSVTEPGAVIFGGSSAAALPSPLPTPPEQPNPNLMSPGNELLQTIRRFDEILSGIGVYDDKKPAVPDPADNPLNEKKYPSYADSLAAVLDGFDAGLQQLLTVESRMGSRMAEAEALQSVGEDLKVQYATSIGNLEDLDIPAAISDFQITVQALTASQKTYQQVTQLSLFNYI
ncbi:flagellar hook-associated protein FlgL [Gulbenkiania mobilis]|uniref:Flagellar hook-associated protein 3 FlgL n=1 Tax=Gulbenkiania mobilis TaxID=397457 RepID=A0ABY2CUQ5_GULMO|nr:flagellar hook-associated protein 3 FlgL [Gulbenkiania mobilis]